MSSPDSLTPSVDSHASGSQSKYVASLGNDAEDEFVSVKMSKHIFETLGLDRPSSRKHLAGEEHEYTPVDYHGTLTRPLAYFGDFHLRSETEELPWISDNTSGKVHPDMQTISMLFNEDLTLPKAAEQFIEQSSVLKEEERWERLKAVFYSFYPEDLKKSVFEALSDMSPREASRIIAMKTSRFENEVILISKPKPIDQLVDSYSESESDPNLEAESCSEDDAVKLNKELSKLAPGYKDTILSVLGSMKSASDSLSRYVSFKRTKTKYSRDVFSESESWSDEVKALQDSTKQCVEARVLFPHIDHAVARYEPRTGWIHVKTQLLRRDSEENKTLPKEIFDVKLRSEYKIKGTLEEKNAAINKQMEHFEHGLRDNAKGHFLEFDFCHNDPAFHLYHVRIPYEKVSPDYCGTIVRSHLSQGNRYCIMSTPQISGYAPSHHEIKVYVEIKENKHTHQSNPEFESTMDFVDLFGCCFNCFSKDHPKWGCEHPDFGFACAIEPEEET